MDHGAVLHEFGRYRLRMAGPNESAQFADMVRSTKTPFEADIGPAIEGASAGSLLLQAGKSGSRAVLLQGVNEVLEGRLDVVGLLTRVSLPLLAVDGQGAAVGALQAIAPGQVMVELQERQWPPEAVLSLAIRAAKVSALWVNTGVRRDGVGTALVRTCCAIYFAAGYPLVYGYFRRSDGAHLADFYSKAGFNLLPHGEQVQLGLGRDGRVLDLGAEPEQGMFYLTRPDWTRRSGD